jgi:hypothetical protein
MSHSPKHSALRPYEKLAWFMIKRKVEALVACKRAGVISEGNEVVSGAPDKIRRRYPGVKPVELVQWMNNEANWWLSMLGSPVRISDLEARAENSMDSDPLTISGGRKETP